MKGRYPWSEADKQKKKKKKCLNRLIFLLQTDLEEISQLFKIVQKKGKTIN